MKRKIVIAIIVLIIIGLLTAFAISFIHKVSVKSHPQQSESIYNSKQDKFYIADFIPNKKSIQLKLRTGTVDLDTAWVEYSWYFKSNSFVTTKERSKVNWYNLCLKVKADNAKGFVWGFEFRDKNIGAIGGYDSMKNQQESTLNTIPDTLFIFFEEKNLNPDIGWMEPIVTDTITYFKKN